LRTSTNLNFIQPKLFGAARQDAHRISDCTVFVIQILGDADVAFRVFGAELWTVLSATTMLTDKLHRLSGRAIAQRFSALARCCVRRDAPFRTRLEQSGQTSISARTGYDVIDPQQTFDARSGTGTSGR
jgi:hypothetical protein